MEEKNQKEYIQLLPDFPLKLLCCNFESNIPHWHPELEILYVVEGELDVFIEKEYLRLKAHDFILINPNQIHHFKRVSSSNISIILQIDSSFLEYYQLDLSRHTFNFNSQIVNKQNHYTFFSYIKKIILALKEKKEGYIVETLLPLASLLLFLTRNANYTIKQDSDLNQKKDERLHRIVHYIDNNFQNKISLNDIASQELLSPTYISHYFSKNMGITFQEYIKNKRLTFGYHQLTHTQLKIIDIALQCGYSDPQTFSNLFKKKFLVSPREVRKQKEESTSNLIYEEQVMSLENSFYEEIPLATIVKILYDS